MLPSSKPTSCHTLAFTSCFPRTRPSSLPRRRTTSSCFKCDINYQSPIVVPGGDLAKVHRCCVDVGALKLKTVVLRVQDLTLIELKCVFFSLLTLIELKCVFFWHLTLIELKCVFFWDLILIELMCVFFWHLTLIELKCVFLRSDIDWAQVCVFLRSDIGWAQVCVFLRSGKWLSWSVWLWLSWSVCFLEIWPWLSWCVCVFWHLTLIALKCVFLRSDIDWALCMISHSTAIAEVFSPNDHKFDLVYAKRVAFAAYSKNWVAEIGLIGLQFQLLIAWNMDWTHWTDWTYWTFA